MSKADDDDSFAMKQITLPLSTSILTPNMFAQLTATIITDPQQQKEAQDAWKSQKPIKLIFPYSIGKPPLVITVRITSASLEGNALKITFDRLTD